ncbi:hypothetical protein [Paracraurococcus ruber]|uniref:Uncharacterized protein n=1 Tax=Paracraurococcus ruber TaxID=77675 RepID=A0ABS1D1F2_9PROT|nr:hypothetical protein [Paracraurococcus ruber]MBK1660127.1 hypothetical protein [Paracraurococcus ruber]TDG28018.1 hypothetical protein E2C05_21550 [Paracraurococcus ruber]
MHAAAITPESLPAAAAFVGQTLAEHPDRGLPVRVLVATLVAIERVEGAVLDGAAVELARRLARLHGLTLPGFPCEFHADHAGLGDRDLALLALRLARQLARSAAPWPSHDAGFLLLAAARLLAADPLIRPPLPGQVRRSPAAAS